MSGSDNFLGPERDLNQTSSYLSDILLSVSFDLS